jgi:hypothetical protein
MLLQHYLYHNTSSPIKVEYHGMGNMEQQHLGNGTSTISMYHLRYLWKSPRGTVLRIQALAVVAIIVSFFLAAFGSCRRWSNRWIVQKGFFAAHALSLSLGTYSIGLMQSSAVKSDMYPIWTVSLFILFGCIDPVTAYNGLDYKGPLSKVAYGICINCGYVLLMSISTISSDVGNTAIGILSAITFIKGFHRSLSLMQQSRMRSMVQNLDDEYGETFVLREGIRPLESNIQRFETVVDFPTGKEFSTDKRLPEHWSLDYVKLSDISILLDLKNKLSSCYNVCIAFCLSHKLHRHFLGLAYRLPRPEILKDIDYKWALEVIEVEMAFLYDVFFTGNPFLYYYQGKTASLWALASFIGICFVAVAVAIPGTITSRTGSSTKVVDTTTADLVITFIILVSLALLQLMQLIQCWTSNWGRVAVACAYARKHKEIMMSCLDEESTQRQGKPYRLGWWMRLKVFVATSTNRFDKYLWQAKIGQYSMLPEGGFTGREQAKRRQRRGMSMIDRIYWGCVRLVKMLGLDYVWEVLWDLLGSDTSKRAAIVLDDDVKASIIEFLDQIKTNSLDENWLSFSKYPIESYLPYYSDPNDKTESHGYSRYASCVLKWHIATYFCELAEEEQELETREGFGKTEEGIGWRETAARYLKKAGCFKKAGGGGGGGGGPVSRNRRVANALSKYCAYLVVSAPELLPGSAPETKRAYDGFTEAARVALYGGNIGPTTDRKALYYIFWRCVDLAKLLLGDDPLSLKFPRVNPDFLGFTKRCDPWETLALFWVRTLVYAAPYGNVASHMRRLSQGGEFISHLWALLYHLDIREWNIDEAERNLRTINGVADAKRILSRDYHAVIAFLDTSPVRTLSFSLVCILFLISI